MAKVDERYVHETVPCVRCGIPRRRGGTSGMCKDCVSVDPTFGKVRHARC